MPTASTHFMVFSVQHRYQLFPHCSVSKTAVASIICLSHDAHVHVAGMQSTIDMLNFWRDSKEAKAQGTKLIHPYNLGLKRNFQVVECTSLLASAAMRLADTYHQTGAHECCEVRRLTFAARLSCSLWSLQRVSCTSLLLSAVRCTHQCCSVQAQHTHCWRSLITCLLASRKCLM